MPSARNRMERGALLRRLATRDVEPPYGVSVHASLLDADIVGVVAVITNEPAILGAVRLRNRG